MTLRQKTLLIISLTALILNFGLLAISKRILLSRFQKIENLNTQVNVKRVIAAADDDAAQLRITSLDYCCWNDAYRFVQGLYPKFPDLNMLDSNFLSLQINFFLYFDSRENLVFSKAYDLENKITAEIPAGLIETAMSSKTQFANLDPDKTESGIIMLPSGPVYIAISPVLTSERKGPCMGHQVLGYSLNQNRLKSLSDRTNLILTAFPYYSAEIGEFKNICQDLVQADEPLAVIGGENEIFGYGLINDIFGKPAILLKISRTREIYRMACNTLEFFRIGLIGLLILTIFLLSFLMKKFILDRLENLSAELMKIKAAGDPSARVSVVSSDEISALAVDINNSLISLDSAGRSLHESEIKFRVMQEKLARAEKMESLGLLAGGVAHDLNNILVGLVSYPDLLLHELPEDSNLREPLETIKNSGKRASAIVQDLLTLARRGTEIGKVLNLNGIVRECLGSTSMLELCAAHPQVSLITELDNGLLNQSGSQNQLWKVVFNLLANSFEAVPAGKPGSVNLSTRNQNLDKPVKGFELIPEGEYVVLEVVDNGIGIPENEMSRIFEPFYSKKVKGRSGTGLGLAVVWGAVRYHNGYIDLQSTLGERTIFRIFFPASREKTEKEEIELVTDGNGETILVVDDELQQRQLALKMLEMHNYKVETAGSGEEAIGLIRNRSFDLIVLDMKMEPGIDGLDAFREIVKIKPGQKVVVLSGFSESDRVREVINHGAGRFLRKPYTVHDLTCAVRDVLNPAKN
ncbi:MAG: response regulator [Candidatus Wallbacteria bacterium]|nr:response regulator [Candidatus Wallbacteria bacterium]